MAKKREGAHTMKTKKSTKAKAQPSEVTNTTEKRPNDDESRQMLAIYAACAVDSLVQTLRREAISSDDDGLFVEYTLDSTLRRIKELNLIMHAVLNGDELDIDEMSVTVSGKHLDGSLAY